MLSQKILLRKPGTGMAILALALLVAIITSMNSVVNYINVRSEALAGLVQIGETYLILAKNAVALTNSQVDMEISRRLTEASEVNQAFPQKILTARMKTDEANLTVTVRAVENVENYLKFYAARLNGAYARSCLEANVGEVLARAAKITLNMTLALSTAEKTVNVKVVGIHRTQSQLDGEILIPLTSLKSLTADSELSAIEFTFKPGVDRTSALTSLAERLPSSVRIVKVQQPGAFMQNLNMQTATFLDVWSVSVYAVVAAASYIITARLTAESTYELALLRALGARKRQILILLIGYVVIIAVLASILGAALGLTAAQVASTLLKWLQPATEIAPFLRHEQILKALALTLASAILGSAIPASRVARLSYMERPL